MVIHVFEWRAKALTEAELAFINADRRVCKAYRHDDGVEVVIWAHAEAEATSVFRDVEEQVLAAREAEIIESRETEAEG